MKVEDDLRNRHQKLQYYVLRKLHGRWVEEREIQNKVTDRFFCLKSHSLEGISS